MIKRASAVLALLTLCLPLAAQQTDGLEASTAETITPEQLRRTGEIDAGPALRLSRPDLFSTAEGSVLIHGLPALTLLDGRRFPLSSGLGGTASAPLDLFPVAFLKAVEVQQVTSSPVHGTDRPGGVVNLRLNRYHSGGEVGVFYGRSDGKYGREDFQTYIIGGLGNDKFHITAGAAYQESSGHIPRFGR